MSTSLIIPQLTNKRLTLEQCDQLFIDGIFNIKQAVIGYGNAGLNSREIKDRLKALGAQVSDRSIRRWIADFKVEGKVKKKERSANAEKQKAYRDRKLAVTNGQNGQTLPTKPVDNLETNTEGSQPTVEVANVSPVADPQSQSSLPTDSVTNDRISTRLQLFHAQGRDGRGVPDVQPTMGASSQGFDEADVPLDPDDPSTFLARDWYNVQHSDRSASFKRAHELLCEFEVLLGQSYKDGWAPEEYHNLATTLGCYQLECANNSAEHRKELEAFGEARVNEIARALERDQRAS